MKPVSTGAFVFVTFSCAAFVAGNKNNLRVFSEIKNGNDSNCSTVNSAAVAIKLTKDGKTTGSHVSSHDRRGLRTGLQFQGSGIGAKTSPSGSAKGPNDFMSRTSNSRLSNTLKSGKYRSTSAAYRRLENSLLAFLGVHDVVQKQKDARQDKSGTAEFSVENARVVVSESTRKEHPEDGISALDGTPEKASAEMLTTARSLNKDNISHAHQTDDYSIPMNEPEEMPDVATNNFSRSAAAAAAAVAERVRRGFSSLQILPENHSERHTYFSYTETCRTLGVSRVMRPPGCLPRRVISSSCQGTCHSRTVPEWHYETQEVRHVAYCTCCKPHQMSFRRVRFNCPGRPRKQLVQFVGVADECACRPCSDGDPEPQQPYDY